MHVCKCVGIIAYLHEAVVHGCWVVDGAHESAGLDGDGTTKLSQVQWNDLQWSACTRVRECVCAREGACEEIA